MSGKTVLRTLTRIFVGALLIALVLSVLWVLYLYAHYVMIVILCVPALAICGAICECLHHIGKTIIG